MRITLLLFVLSLPAFGRNVGFGDIDFHVKTKLIDGKNADVYDIEFWWCQNGRDDIEKRECTALSSCRYDKDALLAEVKKLKASDVKDELELAVVSSYSTKIKAAEYLPELLKLLAAASAGKQCVLVTKIDVKGARNATLTFSYPPLKHGR